MPTPGPEFLFLFLSAYRSEYSSQLLHQYLVPTLDEHGLSLGNYKQASIKCFLL